MHQFQQYDNSESIQYKLHWSKSIITRIALTVVFILVVSSAISLYFGIQSIDSISKYAYDKEVEQTLSESLEQIKSNFSLTQKIIVLKLKHLSEKEGIPSDELKAKEMLKKALEDVNGDIDNITIQQNSASYDPSIDPDTENIFWQDRTNLIFFNYNFIFPKGEHYEKFRATEQIKNRYLVVAGELEKNIRPALIKTNTIIIFISFSILFIIFYMFSSRLRSNIKILLRGFNTWSSSDSSHRISESLPGELGVISHQFNLMAGEVEKNRKRSMHLEKIASWQVIARKLAHEIKNPLTPIQMMVSQLGRRYNGEDEKFAKLLEDARIIITEEVSALRRMVDNFSDFAKLPSPTFAKGDLQTTCKKIVELEKAAYPQHEFRVNSEEAIEMDMDESLLKQVLKNLLKNAAEACTSSALIQITLEDLGTNISLCIEDNGPGIPADNLNRIFEAYFTTKHTGPSPGMGLGLAICQKIILDHNGSINVKSQIGKFTIFEIILPKSQGSTEWKSLKTI